MEGRKKVKAKRTVQNNSDMEKKELPAKPISDISVTKLVEAAIAYQKYITEHEEWTARDITMKYFTILRNIYRIPCAKDTRCI